MKWEWDTCCEMEKKCVWGASVFALGGTGTFVLTEDGRSMNER